MTERSTFIKRTGYRFLLLLFVLLNVLPVSSQQPDFNYRQLGSEEGLNNANIFNVVQHPNDVLYITTQNGIYSYDGFAFARLSIDSLQNNALETAIISDHDELNLSVRGKGLAAYDLHNGSFSLEGWRSFPENNADQVIVTDSFAYLLTSQVKLVTISRSTGEIIADELRSVNENNLPLCIFQAKDGRVLAGRSKGLYDITSGKPRRLQVLGEEPVYSLTQDRQGNILAGSAGIIYVLQEDKVIAQIRPVFETGESTFLPGGVKSIGRITADDYGRIWFTAFPGQNLYLYEFGKVYDMFEILGIQPSLINCLFRDNRQNIWVGTMGDGLYQIQNTFFRSFNFSFNDKILNVNEVYLRDNLLVAATSNGLYALNIRSNQARVLSQPDKVFLEPVFALSESAGVIYYSKRNELSMSPSIFMDAQHVYRFKPVSAREFLPLNADSGIVATWDGYLILTNGDGSRMADTLVSFSDYRIAVNALLVDNGTLYAGTSNGLFTYEFKTGKESHLVRGELNYSINDLALINSRLYAAHDGGLTEVATGKLISSAGGFLLNGVRKARQYQEQVWLATLNGVFVCDSTFSPLKILDKGSGLLSNTINDFSFDGNHVAVATPRGISVAGFASILRHNTRLRPVTIDRLVADGQILRNESNTFSLPANVADITLHFLSPLYSRPGKQYFRYRENEGAWKHFENMTNISLTALSGGRHSFELQASADNIQWSEPVTVVIEKEQRFTEKQSIYWLIGLAIVAIASLVSWLLIRRVKRLGIRRLTQEQQVNLLKHQAMNALLSPHFIFNSLTSIQNYINTNNSLRASEYLAKFSRLIRMIIEKAGQSHITLHDELSRLTYYLELEKERFKNKFDYHIDLDPAIKTQEVTIPNMIIQPYVENSILHGILPKNAPGRLIISFRLVQPDKLVITIDDDGIGLIRAAEHAKTGHKSLGTSTIRSILEVNAKLTGKSQQVQMTDKSVENPGDSGTMIQIELEL